MLRINNCIHFHLLAADLGYLLAKATLSAGETAEILSEAVRRLSEISFTVSLNKIQLEKHNIFCE